MTGVPTHPETAPATRCLLFLPADRPARFATAMASGADAVCLDLEDAVAPDAKDAARRAALELLRGAGEGGPEVYLRINDVRTEAGLRDLLAVCEAERIGAGLVIPKVNGAEEVRWVDAIVSRRHPGVRLAPIVETARGLASAEAIAGSSARVAALLFGGFDLSAELGSSMEWDALLYARSRVVLAGALERIQVLDAPSAELSNPDGLRGEALAAAALGFTGKIAIHPAQVPVIQAAFTPDAEEVRRAEAVVRAFEEAGRGALSVDGRLVDRPVVDAARRILAMSRRATREQG